MGIFDNLIVDPEKIFGKKSWQQLALLELKEDFVKEFKALQKKWSGTIKESQKITKKLITLLKKNPKACGKNVDEFVEHFKNNPDYCLETAIGFAPISQNKIKEIYPLCRKYLQLKENKGIEAEIKILVQKYKLLSFNFSFTALMTAFYKDPFPFVFFDIYRDLREKIWQCIPVDAQFTLGVDPPLYPPNNESRLVIYLYDNCSRANILEHWKIISKKLKELRKMKGVKSRYYPLKNLERGVEIVKTKKRKIVYYDPDKDKDIEKKETDLDIGTDILGEQEYDKIYRKKGRKGVSNIIRQTRYQYKKKFK